MVHSDAHCPLSFIIFRGFSSPTAVKLSAILWRKDGIREAPSSMKKSGTLCRVRHAVSTRCQADVQMVRTKNCMSEVYNLYV